MKVRTTWRPSLLCPLGSRQDLDGELDGEWLWCECPPDPVRAPLGRFGVHLASRVIVAPLEAQKLDQVPLPQNARVKSA